MNKSCFGSRQKDLQEETPLILGWVPVELTNRTRLQSNLRCSNRRRSLEGTGVDDLVAPSWCFGLLRLGKFKAEWVLDLTLGALGRILVRLGKG